MCYFKHSNVDLIQCRSCISFTFLLVCLLIELDLVAMNGSHILIADKKAFTVRAPAELRDIQAVFYFEFSRNLQPQPIPMHTMKLVCIQYGGNRFLIMYFFYIKHGLFYCGPIMFIFINLDRAVQIQTMSLNYLLKCIFSLTLWHSE